MHGYVPEGFFERYMSQENWFAVPLAVICAVPMYANAAGIVPVIQVFVAKGIPLGTAIAFMMGVVGLSLPEATMLKKGDDLAFNRYLFWDRNVVYYSLGISVQSDPVKVAEIR